MTVHSIRLALPCRAIYDFFVTDAAKKLMEQALALPREDRRRLGLALLESLDDDEQGLALHPAWIPEIKRRVEEIESGNVKTVPADEALVRLRARLQKG